MRTARRSLFRRAAILLPWGILSISGVAIAESFAPVTITWTSDVPAETRASVESDIVRRARGRFTQARVTELLEAALSQLAGRGYRNAVIEPGSFTQRQDSVSCDITITPGRLFTIARWELAGLNRTDSVWLHGVLQLPVGVVASDEVLNAARSRVRAFAFLSSSQRPEVHPLTDSTVSARLWLREEDPARLEGALAAGSGAGASDGLTGQFSLGLKGLFRRDRSLRLGYEHPKPDERLLNLDYAERFALSRHLSTGLRMEDWRRDDHRQLAAFNADIHLLEGQPMALTITGNWQKSVPLDSDAPPTRIYETGLGVLWGERTGTHLAVGGVYSRHREWGNTGESSNTRSRFETEAGLRSNIFRLAPLDLSTGARWWGKRDVVRVGDEWFLGGVILRGYPSRSLAARDGVWTRAEFSHSGRGGLGVALFGELAWLTMFDDTQRRPASAGMAILLASPGRAGRIELCWKDQSALRDGILRLSVTQDW